MSRPSVPRRIVIVEDDRRYRGSLELLFASSPAFQLAGSFGSAVSALDEAETLSRHAHAPPWDIVVMDLELPRMNGIEATRRVKALAPDVKVVVLTVFEEPASIVEAICAGADGYLLKKARARELLEGLEAVANGGSPLTPNVARKVLEAVRSTSLQPGTGPAISPHRLDLTAREQEVLRALVDGLSYREAADALGISLGTIRSHISGVYRKLQVHSAAEAVSRAVRQRLV
jgi:DNA-binding NarL/FixJ family response regulator